MLSNTTYPKQIKGREEINYRLGIKSSLSNLEGVFALLYALYLSNKRVANIEYATEISIAGKKSLKIKDDLLDNLKDFFKEYIEVEKDFESQVNLNPLFSSQIESLQMALETFWRLAKISFLIDPTKNTIERSGGERFSKIIAFSTNMLLIDNMVLNPDFEPSTELVSVLYSWLMRSEQVEDSFLVRKILSTLTIFSEETQFKLRKPADEKPSLIEDLIFQQEGIYEVLISNEEVCSKDNQELVGAFRILKSSVREGLHTFIEDDKKNFTKKSDPNFIDFACYTQMVGTYLDLIPKRTVEYFSLEKDEEVKPRVTTSNFNTIFYGAPGTGKSHTVKERLKSEPKENVETVTFHPDYDYVSFVGGYRPVSEKDSNGNESIKYKFVPQVFTNIYVKAWKNPQEPFYLVIEEINRGNCAEIFGDIFQLLDQNHKYTVTPSSELKAYLVQELSGHLEGIADGLKMPNNLSILATMNTSDQSLFPMDSAFKRRWDWEYIPINYDKSNNPSSEFIVEFDDETYFSWLNFIEKVNIQIKNNPNLGMDKCIGNYFINPIDNIISLKSFVNKAIFYLWNDVFKDEFGDESIFAENVTYEDFFPVEVNGAQKVKELFVTLDVELLEKTATVLNEDTN